MKPVAIFRHSPTEGPGYFADYLDRAGVAWELIRIDQNEAVPVGVDRFSGLVLMGGPMSVNDDLPWIPPVMALIQDAVARDVPVLGHCLGGQLMAKALGGRVGVAPTKEIGWGEVQVSDAPLAAEWFGQARARFLSFHWHGETFSIPPGAQRVLSSPWCENQAFVLGPHLGMQCHLEMTEDLIRSWCEGGRREIERSRASPGVQPVAQILENLDQRVRDLHAAADHVYQRWIRAIRRN
jgi:GMP synthase-like glutamine amidotransferase